MFTLIVKGGVVMAPIILLSVVALAIIIERIWVLLSIRLNMALFAKDVFLDLQKGDYARAAEKCGQTRHPVGKMFLLAISNRGMRRENLEKLLEREGEKSIHGLERGMQLLLIIIGVEPMLGFLGTIVGLINAFMAWEQLGANITVSTLAGGIYQAMITTAGGLIAAIPYFICFHLIAGSIKNQAAQMSYFGDQLLNVLGSSRREAAV
jgi:biopolymer transport protein ExbB